MLPSKQPLPQSYSFLGVSGTEVRHFLCWRPFALRDQVFGDGFSLAVLQRLAFLMVRQEQLEAAVIRRKGVAVDEVGFIRLSSRSGSTTG